MTKLSFTEYLDLDKKISEKCHKLNIKTKIALLGSFTLNGFKETLSVKCYNAGVKASFFVSDYNRYMNEMLQAGSGLYRFKPDITYLMVDAMSLLGDIYFNPYSVSLKKRKETARYSYMKLHTIIKKFLRSGAGILIVNNLMIPSYSPLGIMEAKQEFGYLEMIKDINRRMKALNREKNVFVFDYESFCSKIGKDNIIDDKLFYLADMKISPDIIPILSEEYMRYVKARTGLAKKCVVLDLDNTLWGGILGEDGYEAIKLGSSPPGNAFVEFQKSLLALFQRGIILAINSNNNRDDVMEVFKRHPAMILKERHFASMKINWENKVKNLVEISRDINIGLDSMVFFEDDKRIRRVVQEALPEVICPDLPEDPSGYLRLLTEIKEFDTLQFTKEDKKRGGMYASERKRKESIATFDDLAQYLGHLKIELEVRRADKFSIPRLAQLTQRTNQFNFSTKRYDEAGIKNLAGDPGHEVYHIRVKDKYGDYGIAGLVIVRQKDKTWHIDSFLLSCRVLGKNIEDAVIANILEKARKQGVRIVTANYRKTKKNAPVARFLKGYGIFTHPARSGGVNITLYEKNKRLKFNKIDHIRVT